MVRREYPAISATNPSCTVQNDPQDAGDDCGFKLGRHRAVLGLLFVSLGNHIALYRQEPAKFRRLAFHRSRDLANLTGVPGLHDNLHTVEVSGQRQNLISNFILIGGYSSQFHRRTGARNFWKTETFTLPFELMSQPAG